MTLENETTAARRAEAATVEKMQSLAACTFEDSSPLLTLQAFRIAWIARRFAVSPDTAILIASLALGEVTR